MMATPDGPVRIRTTVEGFAYRAAHVAPRREPSC